MSVRIDDEALAAGARNLLVDCAGIRAGDRVLLVCENPVHGWYDAETPQAVARVARSLGAEASTIEVGPPDSPVGPELAAARAAHDVILFFARIGDQDRFSEIPDGKRSVMIYARTAVSLGSAYGTTPYAATKALKEAVNGVLLGADRIEITCPLGSHVVGHLSADDKASTADVTVQRFPLGVPQPIHAAGFSGTVKLARYLTPTGSRHYEPASLAIPGVVTAAVDAGRIAGLDGDPAAVDAVRRHYRHVADVFSIDADFIHSWHAGIHPACTYAAPAADDPDRWSNNVFTHPRYLHFHTCGAYAPGEICWMLLDHTVTVDGIPLWREGRLMTGNFESTAACVADWPVLKAVLDAPSTAIGLDGADPPARHSVAP
jgi:hypothetical protein